jgi:hypothetical protein
MCLLRSIYVIVNGVADLRIRILHFLSVTFKMNIKNYFFALLLFEATFTSFFKERGQRSYKNAKESRFFLLFCLMIEGSGAGSGRPKNIRIRILNADNKAKFFACCRG